jgi:hypothetical protein
VVPKWSIVCRVWGVDDTDMLIDEHAALKLIHQPDVLVVWGAMLLQEVIAQAVKCPKAKFEMSMAINSGHCATIWFR